MAIIAAIEQPGCMAVAANTSRHLRATKTQLIGGQDSARR
jgi:hypothetical protein